MSASCSAFTVLLYLASAPAAAASEPATRYSRIRSALVRSVAAPRFTVSRVPTPPVQRVRLQSTGSGQRDSIWNGLLIGAGIGGVGGYVWARNICGSNDSECFYIAAPVGVLAGAGIGAAVGAVADALHK